MVLHSLCDSCRVPQQIAIENAMYYDACHANTADNGVGKLACEIDKATVNIGAMFSKQVEGKVSTEVKPTTYTVLQCMPPRESICMLMPTAAIVQVDPRLAFKKGSLPPL